MDIQDILSRFANNTVTEAERAEFAAYLKGLSSEEYEALMLQYEGTDQGGVAEGLSDPVMLARILQEIEVLEPLEWGGEEGMRVGGPRGEGGDVNRRRWIGWITVAAAACLLLIAGIYLFRGSSRPNVGTPGAAAIAVSIGPGGNKAVLTLCNGATIVLDSLANGRLMGQGTSDVVKLADGRLQYRAAGDKAEDQAAGNDGGVLYNTLTTPRGGQYQVVLSDGTKVWLNAASAIRYPTAFTRGDREVEVRGEVYFEVARDDSHPFKVKVGVGDKEGMSVDVLGTNFNINAYQDEADQQVRATLLEGAIRVSLGARAQVIRPGQQAGIANGDRDISIKNDVDLESVMAWKNGKLVFNKGDIRELMLEISRWYDVDVQYQGKAPSGGFYGLIDRNVPLTSILHVLDAYGIKTTVVNKTIIVQ